MQSAARTYFQTQVTTTTQGDLLIMLFDGALKFLSQARERILARDYAQKGILISKALDILTELQATLNPQKGGQMAERLKILYLFCSSRLLRANLKMDTDALDETVRILTGLREAFAEANARVESKPVSVTANQSPARLAPVGLSGGNGAVTRQAGAATYAQAGTPHLAAVKPAAGGPSQTDVPADAAAAPLAPQAVIVQAEAPQAQAGAIPRPLTAVRRVMAAYSSRTAE